MPADSREKQGNEESSYVYPTTFITTVNLSLLRQIWRDKSRATEILIKGWLEADLALFTELQKFSQHIFPAPPPPSELLVRGLEEYALS